MSEDTEEEIVMLPHEMAKAMDEAVAELRQLTKELNETLDRNNYEPNQDVTNALNDYKNKLYQHFSVHTLFAPLIEAFESFSDDEPQPNEAIEMLLWMEKQIMRLADTYSVKEIEEITDEIQKLGRDLPESNSFWNPNESNTLPELHDTITFDENGIPIDEHGQCLSTDQPPLNQLTKEQLQQLEKLAQENKGLVVKTGSFTSFEWEGANDPVTIRLQNIYEGTIIEAPDGERLGRGTNLTEAVTEANQTLKTANAPNTNFTHLGGNLTTTFYNHSLEISENTTALPGVDISGLINIDEALQQVASKELTFENNVSNPTLTS